MRVIHGDCIEEMRAMPDASIDAIVTDPPYGLGFMGKAWDGLPPGEDWARECLRVLKPGGHLLAFGGTRTWHRLAVAVEDAGFEIRDSIAWLYGSGFPKSLDVSKAIDKTAGAEREVVGRAEQRGGLGPGFAAGTGMHRWGDTHYAWDDLPQEGRAYYEARAGERRLEITAPATPEAEQWQGWGTALKPAFEPIVVGRKPLNGTVAANVLAHGTGALNIDACRVEGEVPSVPQPVYGVRADGVTRFGAGSGRNGQMSSAPGGRWPANVVLDDTQAAELTESRFFYVAKAPKRERPTVDGVVHPTVKPLALMRWLVRLVTPPSGVVLDPFAGSGTTIEAALLEGFDVIGIEREAEYLPLIEQRIARASA